MNLDQLSTSNNQPMTATNQVGYTMMIRYTIGLGNYMDFGTSVGLGVVIGISVGSDIDVTFGVDNGMGSGSGNSIGSDGNNGLGLDSGNNVSSDIDNDVDSSSNNGMDSSNGNGIDSNVDIDISNDLEERLVCLGIQTVGTVTGLAFSKIYIIAFISFITNCSYLILTSSVNQVIKPPHLLLYIKVVFILAVI